MAKSEQIKADENDVREGDVREGTGGLHVRVRVVAIDGDKAQCALTRSSGRVKQISIATLRKSYKLLSRGEPEPNRVPVEVGQRRVSDVNPKTDAVVIGERSRIDSGLEVFFACRDGEGAAPGGVWLEAEEIAKRWPIVERKWSPEEWGQVRHAYEELHFE